MQQEAMMTTAHNFLKTNYFNAQLQEQQEQEPSFISDSPYETLIYSPSLRQFHDNRHARNATYSPLSSVSPFDSSSIFISQGINDCSQTERDFDKSPRRLRFEVILEAATAVTQKAEESTITYLNRGQTYGIQLTDKQAQNEIITSTISIDFHSSSHRCIAENYWKYWISQQKQPDPRAIDIDASQSTGITELSFPSFDKIMFNWNGSHGAKIFVRFRCLSTDFSRIKGVKGIPLRAQMESTVSGETILGKTKLSETCFCKVKLFRDKGAERKNKDDAKQISKQLEKVYGKASEQSLPLMYNVSLPYSVFGEIPLSSSTDSFETIADFPTSQQKKSARYHTRIMTAPNPSFFRDQAQDQKKKHQDSYASKTKDNYDFYDYLHQQQKAITSLPALNTNNLSYHQHDLLEESQPLILGTSPLDDDLPPLTADTLYTPGTMQVTPMDYSFGQDMMIQQPSKSIYDVFTPEEIQQPQETFIPQTSDYFYNNQTTSNQPNITLLQQQLHLHNQVASNIILNSNAVSDMLLLSSSSSMKKRKSSYESLKATSLPTPSISDKEHEANKKRRCST
ncbi:CP2 transcription factor-domain-containing protein [Gilbertella persicaria]|uniref:CP2 transcription factor-domain-containing protein n=1 Tax=Gilbertella persicaria TaxID=101096 RepID=UPI00221F7372|nr:CP2 transcription factor-domain-containing protein [Gilbertella persicaria]KAI8047136.1 CP2 transcription factor-domain-containing protein [Gilbertella persicaria]